jgi:hypothetical protein
MQLSGIERWGFGNVRVIWGETERLNDLVADSNESYKQIVYNLVAYY